MKRIVVTVGDCLKIPGVLDMDYKDRYSLVNLPVWAIGWVFQIGSRL